MNSRIIVDDYHTKFLCHFHFSSSDLQEYCYELKCFADVLDRLLFTKFELKGLWSRIEKVVLVWGFIIDKASDFIKG